MAKQSKALPARRQRDVESPLVRSAESLGRMIASLQRELDDTIARLKKPDRADRPAGPDGHVGARTGVRGAGAPPAARNGAIAKGRGKAAATNVRSAIDFAATRTQKAGTRTKTAGRRSGARKAAGRTTRGS